ncbi:MAG: thiol reductase thioredoxin [Verrucomicrobia bacterium]|nr:thiol reductase thioredoxin [Verrucomicrobiota bacterium]
MNSFKEIWSGDFMAEVLNAPTPVVVLFDSPECVPCEALKPMIQNVRRRFRSEVEFATVTVAECPGLAQRYGIVKLPTLGIFYEGALQDTFTPQNEHDKP